ncbi:MAG: hypothetical protein ACLQF2_04305 [Rhodomicrobium sp.]
MCLAIPAQIVSIDAGYETDRVARYNFVRKVPKSRTPVTIARHRDRRRPLAYRSAL